MTMQTMQIIDQQNAVEDSVNQLLARYQIGRNTGLWCDYEAGKRLVYGTDIARDTSAFLTAIVTIAAWVGV